MVSFDLRGNAKFINTDANSGKGWNIWERMLCLHDARWKARCAESVQLSFGFYEWEYSNDFLPYGKGEKIFTRKSITPYNSHQQDHSLLVNFFLFFDLWQAKKLKSRRKSVAKKKTQADFDAFESTCFRGYWAWLYEFIAFPLFGCFSRLFRLLRAEK